MFPSTLRRGFRLLSQQKRAMSSCPPPKTPAEKRLHLNYQLSMFFRRYGAVHINTHGEPAFVTMMKREKLATVLLAGTIPYVMYANGREHKDTRLFDRYGDLDLPIISPIWEWFGTRFGQTSKIFPDQDPFEHFSAEEREERLRALDAGGYFNRFWLDQGDDWDKNRLMIATTQDALWRSAEASYFHPETDNTTISQLRQMQANKIHFNQPKLEVQYGDKLVTFETKADRECHRTINAYDAMFKTEKEKQLEKVAYQFNTQPLPSDVAAMDKLFGV